MLPILLGAALAALALIAYSGSGVLVHSSYRTPLTAHPEQFHLPVESLSFKTRDGLILKGWFIPAPSPTPRTVILLHGWGDNKGDILSGTRFLNQQEGLNLFYFDFRACGESEGEISSIGYLESLDFDAAMDFIKQHKNRLAEHLGVYGHSMGAAVALWGTAHHSEIKAVVSESSFDSYNRMVSYYTRHKHHLPYFPFALSILLGARLRLGGDPEPYSPIYWIDRISPRPVLLIHGAQDAYTPPDRTETLFQRAKDPKEIWIVPGASHAQCAEKGGKEYQRRIGEFFRRYL